MAKWFYAAWAIAVVGALVVPMVIAHATTSNAAGLDPHCVSRLRAAILNETPYAVLPFPAEVQYGGCPNDSLEEPSGRMIIRGPYGIPIADGNFSSSSISSPDEGGVVVAVVILVAGAVLVSLPFVFVLLLSYFGKRRPNGSFRASARYTSR